MDEFIRLHSAQLESMGVPSSTFPTLYEQLSESFQFDNHSTPADNNKKKQDDTIRHLMDSCEANMASASSRAQENSELKVVAVPFLITWDIISDPNGIYESLQSLDLKVLNRVRNALVHLQGDKSDEKEGDAETDHGEEDAILQILELAWERIILYMDDGKVRAGLPCPPYLPNAEEGECALSLFPFLYYPSPSKSQFCSIGFVTKTSEEIMKLDLVPRWSCPDESYRDIRLAALLSRRAPPASLERVKTAYTDFIGGLHLVRQRYLEERESHEPAASGGAVSPVVTDKKLVVYIDTDCDFMSLHHPICGLTDPRFELTADIAAADIIFTSDCLFSPKHPHHHLLAREEDNVFINQFPYEGAFVQKDHLAREIQKQYGYPGPNWSLDSFDLDVQLGEFVGRGMLLREEERSGDLWIIKPAKGTRSMGHVVTNDLAKVAKLVDCNSGGRVAQKYIKNPVCYKNRKIDCRIVVMMTNKNPESSIPQLYMHNRVYFRIARKEHNVSTPLHHMDNLSVLTAMHHLDNINDDEEDRLNDVHTIDHEVISYLESTYPQFQWKETMLPKIHTLIRELFTNMTGAYPQMLSKGKNSRAVYGMDVMFEIEKDSAGEDTIEPKLTEVSYCPANLAVCDAYERDEDNYRNYVNDVFQCLFLGEISDNITTLVE